MISIFFYLDLLSDLEEFFSRIDGTTLGNPRRNAVYSKYSGNSSYPIKKSQAHYGYRPQIIVPKSSDRFGNQKSKRLENKARTN